MGQIVEVVERRSSRPGIVRYETNRVLSGTGHDRFVAGRPVEGERPVDELARRLFARGGVATIHINGGIVTVDLEKGYTSDGLADIIRGLYTFYEVAPAAETAALAAVEAAPDEERAAGAPVLQGIEAAEALGVEPEVPAGEAVAERNAALAAEAAERPEPS